MIFSISLFTFLLISLLILSEYIFFEPYLIWYIPHGGELGFFLIVSLSVLSALVLPMNIYRIKILKKSKSNLGGSFFSSFVGSIAGACSCGPIGLAAVSTFGSVGATTFAFLTNFEIPIRIGAIMLLLITYYTTVKSLKTECKLV